ncbi:MAG: class I SAM-dependent methyltransferase [Pseudomonadota bacterium]
MEYFLEIFGTLPRAGPGSPESTQRAYRMMTDVPQAPHILDLGCGPGRQTVDLLRLSDGTVLALDLLPLMVERTRANAEEAQVADRLQVVEQDMRHMDFDLDAFDVIWSEAAIYNLGFEEGLRAVRQFVRPGGHVVVSEVVWLQPDPPEEVTEFWKQYPEVDTIANKEAVIDRLGYQPEGHFVLPDRDWTHDYYDPMDKLLADKSREWVDQPEGLAVIEEAREEVDLYRNYSAYYGYAFFVMRRPEES